MKRLNIWLGLALLLSVLLVGGILFTRSSVDASAFSSTPHHPPTSFQVRDSYVSGNPAIKPHLVTANTASNASSPGFLKKDVEDFLNKNGFFAGPVVNGGHLKIVSIQFVTAKEASQFMAGESVGRPDDYLVCYVKVQGPFSHASMHQGPVDANTKAQKLPDAEFGDMVFDGHTGNLLVWGVY